MAKSRVIGRPRSEKSREAILDAAFRVLVARGYAGFTIEAVAAEANSGKTTVYRWWPTKGDLAAEAFFHATTEELQLPESASAQADFRMQITELATLLRGERGQALAAMLGGARTDSALGRALGERWLEPRRRWGMARMLRAESKGQLRADVQPGAALAVLYGPLYAPLLFGGEVPNAESVQAYLDVACRGIFTDP
ncbi:TetR/AcrR family transcriptional regulator [Gemmatimonas groenlandica]|uniref:TetR/AcrR family transcriptional regulator n=1 Tax=Gemmatimonas groenlandica TaxID=2732249 RepID=A0A6M4IQD8_9BACT|nr:TetR/AcrR family transcriptional regulator [Gemmatimonas groenlandica]QJR37134.1 TetR/AcrR family transcriptional regulator [Gemmatimonas groenlandica]